MAEEYHERTRDFAGTISQKLPFALYRRPEDYWAAGGIPGTEGVFVRDSTRGDRLLAIAGDKTDGRTWHVIQHEGFHQFASAVIGGDMPMWVNEGLAEYFGESLFTGDSFVSGIIPPRRAQRVKDRMAGKDAQGREVQRFKSVREMMLTSHEQWNAEMNVANYDQAWSMVQFLAHGDEGKYRRAFGAFMVALSRGKAWSVAWREDFGSAEGFEEKWRAWWESLPASPTQGLYAKAAASIMTSFLGRAYGQKQTFDGFEEFAKAGEAGDVKTGADWLPPALLKDALAFANAMPAWTIQPTPGNVKQPQILGVLKDGTRVTGVFVLRGARVEKILVDVDETAVVVARARELIGKGEKGRARGILLEALKEHPKSAAAGEARKALLEAK
jgi:hypothetical protein